MEDAGKSVPLASGYSMPFVGLGTWQTSGESSVVENAVRAAIDAGYRHIDTARVYNNESLIGNALKKLFDEGLVKRSEIFVVTKLPSNGHKDVEYFFRKSLDALQMDYIDLYLIHSPTSAKRTDDDDDFMPLENGKYACDLTTDLVETWKGMESLVDKGLARSIGLSNFNSKQIQRILDNCRIKPANLQVECHVYLPQYELHNLCKKNNISFTAYAPIGSPGLSSFIKNRMNKEVTFPVLLNEPKVKELAKKYNKTEAQVLIRHLIQRGIIVIPKSANATRIKENIQVFDFNLSDEDMDVLKSLQNGYRYFKFDQPEGWTDHPEHPFKEPF